jgi:hypothetical protein
MQTIAIWVGILSGIVTVAVVVGGLVRWVWGKISEGAHKTAAVFRRDAFRLPSTGYLKTAFAIDCPVAGAEARAERGGVVKGDGLTVRLQDQERSEKGLGVWLTVHNGSSQTYRWFGSTLTCYAHPRYAEIEAALHDGGGHLIFDVYPGEQYTAYYFFPFTPNVRAPKFLTCKSWDVALTFWWARGA